VTTSTSLNLRALLKTAIARSGMDVPAHVVSGLTSSAKALFVAAAARARLHGVVVYVVPSDADLEQAVADISFFLSALEGLTTAAAERAVLPFPSHEVDPYRGLAPHVGVTSARARALYGIGRGNARVVIASGAALLPRVTPPLRLLAASLELKPGMEIAPIDLAELLVDAGFSREDPADEHGEFAVRGGIVDIFPAGELHPVRLEFIGDTIETIRTYDPSTQRSVAPIDQIAIVPLRDVLARPSILRRAPDSEAADSDASNKHPVQDGDEVARLKPRATLPQPRATLPQPRATTEDFFEEEALDRSATFFDHLARAKDVHLIVSERDEVDANAAKLLEQIQSSYESIVRAEAGPAGSGADGAAATPPDSGVLAEEWEELSAEDDADIVVERAELKTRRRGLKADGKAPDLAHAVRTARRSTPPPPPAQAASNVPPPHDLFADWSLVETRLAHATNLAYLGLDDDAAPGTQHLAPSTWHPAPGTQHPAPGTRHPAPGTRDVAPGTPLKALPAHHIRCQPAVEMKGRVTDWVAEIRHRRDAGETTLFVAATAGRAERMIEVLKEYDVFAVPVERADDARYAAALVAVGGLSKGFRLPDAGLQIYAEPDVFEEERRAPERRHAAAKAFLSDLRDLKVGDLVVHVDHGIGVFVGLKQIGVGDSVQEFLELRYAGDDKLFVPVERLDLVQKYTGATRPPIDRLGGTSWERAKSKVKKAMRDMAEELLKLYAARRAVPGHAFSPDSHWQQEFEDAFEYELTPDQKSAIADIKRDMEASTPMDRLLCGDVGYGKTEVAMRAAFKAVMEGKQVAFLAPTTVLAFQHQKTLRERFAGFPVRIDMVSRFRSKAEQKEAIADLAAGKIDIIVGTHRLLSKDVQFRDLGLLVVDEEQRFGVSHKEKVKQLRKKVDVLTMSATPIPRTLNMSLVGIRDMSIIETPPKDRLSIQTNVVKFDQSVIGRAIRNELARGGQVYFVHNRVESIFSIGGLVQRLVPEARVVVGHGQMDEELLERAMLDFVARKFDVLLATTIVENGLDIPNANTIVINRADRYGLSQLYQLRGRVGRSDRPAYAYLLIPPEDNLSPVAKKRLAAIKEFSDLGSGFRVAALDLEIRGAGNLLGGEQSGHIETVGFEMYMKLLEQTVRELKGEELEDDVRATVNLRVDLRIEESYVPDMNQRLMLYRKVAAARREDEIDRVLDEAADRYGPLPDSVLNLADYGRIRVMADRLGIDTIDREGRTAVLKFRPQARVDPVRLVSLVRQRPDLTLVPPAALRLTLEVAGGAGVVAGTTGLRGHKPPAVAHAKGRSRSQATAPSWWTARARETEVKPGFTKAEILKPAREDPRAPGGVFERVGGLLSDLLEQG
jgi:transcription-repair coupling factor